MSLVRSTVQNAKQDLLSSAGRADQPTHARGGQDAIRSMRLVADSGFISMRCGGSAN